MGDKSRQTYRLNLGKPLALVNYVWYIEGFGEKILIDAGGSPEFFRGLGIPLANIQTIDSGLSRVGMDTDDIDLVVLTHLHSDHVGQASRFRNARFLIQKDELEFGRNPHPAVVSGYVQEFFEGLNFVQLSGDRKICDGLSVIKTPGHTEGGQSVCIETTAGIVIISGLCTIRENFEPPSPISHNMSVIVPTIHTNVLEAYDSLMKIKKVADIVLPLHDTYKNLQDLDANVVRFELPGV
jgi:glyoxylase-like metal-dependent hydrolase (beta-lactamase superfamily II)